jgi:glycosyltransferase involved in cell wall biosynthesis
MHQSTEVVQVRLAPPGTRVCIFPGHLRTTGAVRVMLNLAGALSERGVAVDLFLTHRQGELAHMIPGGVTVIAGRGSNVRSLLHLVRYLRARRPHALLAAHHADNVVSVLACAIARVRTRVIVTIHNDRSVRTGGLRLRLLTLAMRLAYRRAHAIVAVSHGVAEDASTVLRLPPGAIRVIYNPTITPRLLAAADEPVDHPWLASGKTVILGVGRLTEQKDFATLIRAFALVRGETDARLLILGEGEDRPALERLARELGVSEFVALPGVVANAVAYMRRASLLALSSRWEGLPGVLIEALAVGTPVVSTDCPSGAREVLADGRYGALVPVGDHAALAAAILATLHSPLPRDELVARGRSFSAERAVSQYLNLVTA